MPPIYLEEHRIGLTASIGISRYPDDGTTWENLMKHADMEMYCDKRLAKQQTETYKCRLFG